MSELPLVSVCIGVYNREKLILDCLNSVFSQTYPNLEVIVVEDASTDRTLAVLREHEDKIRIIKRNQNSGLCSVTRNQAVKAARGKYVALLDSDDLWFPEKIEKQVEFMEANPQIPLCHTYCALIDKDGVQIGIRHESQLRPSGDYFEFLLQHCWITISSVMVRNTVFEEIGYFDEDPRCGIWGEDVDFFLRVASKYQIGLIDEVLAAYRKTELNTSAGNWKKIPESIGYYEILIRERQYIWQGRISQKKIKEYYINNCITNSAYWRYKKQWRKSLYFLCKGGAMQWISPCIYIEGVRLLYHTISNLFRHQHNEKASHVN